MPFARSFAAAPPAAFGSAPQTGSGISLMPDHWDANPSLALMLHRLRNELDPSWDRLLVPPGLRD